MRLTIVSVIFALSYLQLTAQFSETIRSGRPGQSIGPFAVGPRVLQVQSGFNHAEMRDGNSRGQISDFETVIRYGITNDLEISSLSNVSMQRFASPDSTLSGLDKNHFGLRYHIMDCRGWIPGIGFQYRVKLPALSSDFRPTSYGSVFTLVTQNEIGKRFVLVTNSGLDWNGNDANPTAFYVLNFSWAIGERWSLFVENYGNAVKGDFDTFFDGGLAFLVSNNLQLDLWGGAASNDGTLSYFVNSGISFRLRHGAIGEK